jgi:tRNA threonylcarbamoyladenosine biosynthesis protein TsaE
MQVVSSSDSATERLGHELGSLAYGYWVKAQVGFFLSLQGTLGAGKTQFARGFIQGWVQAAGSKAELITSPTFSIVNEYCLGNPAPLAHLDLYRLDDMRELENLGYEEYFFNRAATVVEWLDKFDALSHVRLRPSHAMIVTIEIPTYNSTDNTTEIGTQRRIEFVTNHVPHQKLLLELRHALENKVSELLFESS